MKNIVYVAACALLVCTSCVTKKKYMIAENGRLEAVGRGDALKEELVNCKDEADRQTDWHHRRYCLPDQSIGLERSD